MARIQETSTEHNRLVKALIDELKNQGFEITNAICEGYETCAEVDGKVPDVKAYNRKKDFVVFGLVKISEDLCNEQTEEEFKLFSCRFMSKGKAKGVAVHFCIAITKGSEKQLETILIKLKLDKKKNVFRFAF